MAEGVLKYFAQPTIQLLDSTSNRSLLFRQKIKASARMIAGVRAGQDLNWNRNSEPGQRLRIDCPHAVIAAGPHGQLLAARLRKALPQLTDMVIARTQHIDHTISHHTRDATTGTDWSRPGYAGVPSRDPPPRPDVFRNGPAQKCWRNAIESSEKLTRP